MPALSFFIRAAVISQIIGCCLAQGPAFDAASVRLASSAERYSGMTGGPGTSDPGRVRFGKVTLTALLATAFGVQPDQISGPLWIGDAMGPDKYDVVASMAPDTTREQFRTMLRKLLADRFELVVHHGTRNVPGYELVIAKGGAQLIEAQVSKPGVESAEGLHRLSVEKDGWPILPQGSHSIRFALRDRERVMYQERSMAGFAEALGPMIGNSIGGDPAAGWPRVADKTGLTAKYTFKLEYSCARCAGMQSERESPPGALREQDPLGVPNIFGALERQLGLSLQKAKSVPIELIVVDHALKVPTAN